MNRFPIESNSKEIRLDRNECIVPSIIDRLLNKVNIEGLDYTQYVSSFNVLSKLSNLFNCLQSNLYADNGSEQVLKALVQVIDCNQWVTTSPTFEMFPFYVSAYGKKLSNIDFTYSDRFNINLHNYTTNAGLYLVSPHNPTGFTVSVEDILKLCSNYKYVVLDQAYITPTEQLDIMSLPNNLIIVRTFSKMGGLTGMRFGFCVSRNTDIIESLNQIRPMYLNAITLKLVDKLLEESDLLKDIIVEFKKVKDLLNLKPIAEAGNFILLKDISQYKDYNLKQYKIDKKVFYRLTLFDLKTFYSL